MNSHTSPVAPFETMRNFTQCILWGNACLVLVGTCHWKFVSLIETDTKRTYKSKAPIAHLQHRLGGHQSP